MATPIAARLADETRNFLDAQASLDHWELSGSSSIPYESVMRCRNKAREHLEEALSDFAASEARASSYEPWPHKCGKCGAPSLYDPVPCPDGKPGCLALHMQMRPCKCASEARGGEALAGIDSERIPAEIGAVIDRNFMELVDGSAAPSPTDDLRGLIAKWRDLNTRIDWCCDDPLMVLNTCADELEAAIRGGTGEAGNLKAMSQAWLQADAERESLRQQLAAKEGELEAAVRGVDQSADLHAAYMTGWHKRDFEVAAGRALLRDAMHRLGKECHNDLAVRIAAHLAAESALEGR